MKPIRCGTGDAKRPSKVSQMKMIGIGFYYCLHTILTRSIRLSGSVQTLLVVVTGYHRRISSQLKQVCIGSFIGFDCERTGRGVLVGLPPGHAVSITRILHVEYKMNVETKENRTQPWCSYGDVNSSSTTTLHRTAVGNIESRRIDSELDREATELDAEMRPD